ncbi:Asp23/Gls24 family envelope stress response protein [Streptomyces sp. NPDC006430]|uniref:Asp23/Gls24 family envelope stress response protein n=1 Tax=Streptomyces sp. NPDC006430 TaxID=3154299 RepID=UPI0033BF0718
MTSQPAAAPAGGAATPSTRPVIPAAERGATVIPEKVVARIVVRAAQEALAKHAVPSPGSMKLAAPHASVTVGGGTARLGLTLDLPYPIDLASTAQQVQHYVSERVGQLTGMRVTEVTVDIEHLVPSGGLEHRRVQ